MESKSFFYRGSIHESYLSSDGRQENGYIWQFYGKFRYMYHTLSVWDKSLKFTSGKARLAPLRS